MSDWYDRKGQPLEMEAWAKLLGDAQYKIVARDELPGDVLVSTIWLGLDHGFGGRRLIFETMVFRGGDVDDQFRYSTEDEALAGHKETVEAERAKSLTESPAPGARE